MPWSFGGFPKDFKGRHQFALLKILICSEITIKIGRETGLFSILFLSKPLTTAAGAAAGVAFQAGAVAHQGEVAALAARIASYELAARRERSTSTVKST